MVPYRFTLSHPGTIKFKFTPTRNHYTFLSIVEIQRTPSKDNPDEPCAFFYVGPGKEPTETDYYMKRNASFSYNLLDPTNCDWYIIVNTTGSTKSTTKCDLFGRYHHYFDNGSPKIRCHEDPEPDPEPSPSKASKESLNVTFIIALFFFAFTMF